MNLLSCQSKKSWLIVLTLFLYFGTAFQNVSAEDKFSKVPDDFHLIAIAGGVSPAESVSRLEINAKGEGVYSEMLPKNRVEGEFKEKKRFELSETDMGFLYHNITKNNFFSLKESYKKKGILDGSFAELTITAGGKTHKVRTQNMAVPAFDDIVVTINVLVPEDSKILYNEIL